MRDLTYGEAKPRVELFCTHRSSLKFIVCGTCEEAICIELYDALLCYFISMVGKSVTQKVNFTIFKICVWKFWFQNWCSKLCLIVSCLWNFAWQPSGSMKSKPKWEALHVNSRSWTSVYCIWTSCSLHEYWFIFYLVGVTKNNSNRLQCFVSPLDNSKQQLKSELPLSGLWDFVKWSLSLRWSIISLDRKKWSTYILTYM